MKGTYISKCSFFWNWDIFLDVLVLYNKIRKLNTQPMNEWKRVPRKKLPMDYTNTGLYRFIYGLYQYMDYINNERVKRVPYTIYQQMKRYNHFNTTTHDKKCNAILLTSSPKMQHNTLPQDERTTTNNIFILQPTRELYTTDGTIPPYKTTSI